MLHQHRVALETEGSLTAHIAFRTLSRSALLRLPMTVTAPEEAYVLRAVGQRSKHARSFSRRCKK
eukprot:194112-Chlamydomonas_euryale.AAC.2